MYRHESSLEINYIQTKYNTLCRKLCDGYYFSGSFGSRHTLLTRGARDHGHHESHGGGDQRIPTAHERSRHAVDDNKRINARFHIQHSSLYDRMYAGIRSLVMPQAGLKVRGRAAPKKGGAHNSTHVVHGFINFFASYKGIHVMQ